MILYFVIKHALYFYKKGGYIMYWKVIHNKRVIDVLSSLQYVKYQMAHNILLLCNISEAEGILSADGSTAYHTQDLLSFPVDDYPTVTLEEITKVEYDRLSSLHLMTPEEIIDKYTQELIDGGVI